MTLMFNGLSVGYPKLAVDTYVNSCHQTQGYGLHVHQKPFLIYFPICAVLFVYYVFLIPLAILVD